VPQYALDVFNDVATAPAETAEFNWLYVSAAQGGSGLCTATPPCLPPLNLTTGWQSAIEPLQVTTVVQLALQNAPEPLYMSQSGLTGDRLGLQVLSSALAGYAAVYAPSAPLENPSLTAAGQVLAGQAAWGHARHAVTGYVQGGIVTIKGPAGTVVPFTAPARTTVVAAGGALFGAGYGSSRSGEIRLGASARRLALSSVLFGAHPVRPAVGALRALPRGSAHRPAGVVARLPRRPGGALGAAIRRATY